MYIIIIIIINTIIAGTERAASRIGGADKHGPEGLQGRATHAWSSVQLIIKCVYLLFFSFSFYSFQLKKPMCGSSLFIG